MFCCSRIQIFQVKRSKSDTRLPRFEVIYELPLARRIKGMVGVTSSMHNKR